MKTISIIAPIALSEQLSDQQTWRQPANSYVPLRVRTMLQSFFTRFDPSSIESFTVVCPDRDYAELEQLIREAVPESPVKVLPESVFFSLCEWEGVGTAGFSGYEIQQIVKLGYAKLCKTDYYLTLDCDIIQIRAAGFGDLFPDGERALIGIETPADYERLYTAAFSKREREAKEQYYLSSQAVLGYDRPLNRAGIFFSETPVLLNRRAVLDMIGHIETIQQKGIVAVLEKYWKWTEYSLYFQFLEMTGALDRLHVCGSCNAVLWLEKSIWQPTGCYRSERFYDAHHFRSSAYIRQGPFLAIQSWVRVDEWLGTTQTLPDFYSQLETWLAAPTEYTDAPNNTQQGALDALRLPAFLRILEQVDPASALFRRSRELLDTSLERTSTPAPTEPREKKFLTIGMTTHDDYDGCYFTIQSIRLFHPEILDDVEFLLIDNNPTGPCARPLSNLKDWAPNYRYVPYSSRKGTAVRDLLFREATGDFVLCVDCHVLFAPGSLRRFLDYCRSHPDTNDLLQGPLISDALEPMATHFKPEWSFGMFGVWGMDDRAQDVDAEPFEIPMQGLGVFGCRREAWPGFNSKLAGFGGEEGYIHEKIRRRGGRNLCLPSLRWMHRFERPLGVPYRHDWLDRVRNYLLIHEELQLDPAPVIQHFTEFLGEESCRPLVKEVQAELSSPFHLFDAIYCINLDKSTERWTQMQARLEHLGIARAVRRFSAAATPLNHHIGCALSHRRIIQEAKQQQLKTVLVLEDDALFSPNAAEVLALSLKELEKRDWQLLYLGGYRNLKLIRAVEGCKHLVIPDFISCTHAIAYHHSVYDAILNAVPDNATDVALWARKHLAIDQFLTFTLKPVSYLVNPVVATQDSLLPEETWAFSA